jgi:hypothetical protein
MRSQAPHLHTGAKSWQNPWHWTQLISIPPDCKTEQDSTRNIPKPQASNQKSMRYLPTPPTKQPAHNGLCAALGSNLPQACFPTKAPKERLTLPPPGIQQHHFSPGPPSPILHQEPKTAISSGTAFLQQHHFSPGPPASGHQPCLFTNADTTSPQDANKLPKGPWYSAFQNAADTHTAKAVRHPGSIVLTSGLAKTYIVWLLLYVL